MDSLFGPLPASVHVYRTTSLIDGKPNIAYYLEADLKDKKLDFTVDTTYRRRLTPAGFFEKNKQPCLYRIHEGLTPEKLEALRSFLHEFHRLDAARAQLAALHEHFAAIGDGEARAA